MTDLFACRARWHWLHGAHWWSWRCLPAEHCNRDACPAYIAAGVADERRKERAAQGYVDDIE